MSSAKDGNPPSEVIVSIVVIHMINDTLAWNAYVISHWFFSFCLIWFPLHIKLYTSYLDGSHTSVANIIENTANAEADTSENCKSQPVVAYVSVHIDAWSSDEHKQFDEETSLPFLN